MVFKKMRYKNSQTLTGVVMMMLLVMGIFFATYYYINSNITSSGADTLDSKYSIILENLTASQNSLDINIRNIKGNASEITEAPDVFQTAWNGLKRLGSTLILPFTFFGVLQSTFEAIFPTLDFLPNWLLPLISIGIMAFLVLLILKILKGEPNL